ncbi:MAG: DUF721 domain-containing protein [Alloprevotella sp.]|nr:DUF721 domain-containing protein [Alloprevotella sp.]
MERRKSETLGAVLSRVLAQSGLQSALNERRLIGAWPNVVGEVAARHTRELFISKQALFVRLDSPALRTNLSMQRTDLVRLLNARVGAQVITDVRFV